MRRIEGWFTRLDAVITAAVAQHQAALGVSGSVGEIGVHHGRSFLVLALGMRASERAFAVDLFGRQELNEDRSGRGDEAAFRRNLAANGVDADRVAILSTASTAIGWPDIERLVGARARLISVDGGHTAAVVLNDLELAHAGLGEAGVVILDDYFDRSFPGVSEGTARFMIKHPDALAAFAIGDSRVFLGRPEWAARYRDMLTRSQAAHRYALTTHMWGATVDVYRSPERAIDHVRSWRITQAVLRAGWSQPLKRPLRRLLERDL